MSGKILLTRPQERAKGFAREVRSVGFEVLNAPMLEVEAMAFDVPDLSPYQALIFTSVDAVQIFCRRVKGRDLPVYVVGKQTEDEARAQGFREVYSANGDGDALVDLIDNEAPDQARPFLHGRGVHVARPIDELLKSRGFDVDNLIVYEAQPISDFSPAVLDILKSGDIEAVAFFSKRTVENFIKLVRENDIANTLESIKALCISASVLECVQSLQWSETYISDRPDRAGMLEILTRVCSAQTQRQGDIMSEDNQEEKAMSAAKKSKGSPIENATEVIERFGGIRPMAKKINVAVTTVQGWKKRDVIPAGRRQVILDAAEEHKVDLSGVLSGAPEVVDGPPANENQQGSGAHTPQNISEETAAIAAAVESVLEDSDPVILSDKVASTSVPSATSDLKAAPRTLDKKLRQTETNAVKKSTWINFSLLLLGLMAFSAFVLFGGQDKANEQRIGALEEDVGQLRGDVSAVKEEQSFLSTLIPADLDVRIQRIQDQALEAQQKVNQAIATAGAISNDVLGEDAGTLEERAVKLQEHVSASPQIQSLLARFQGMSESDLGRSQLDKTVSDLNNALTGAGDNLGLNEALESARAATPNLDETFSEVPAQELKAAALLLGMTQLRGALNRDNEAFGDDLQLLKNLVGGDEQATTENSALIEALDKLAPSAKEGVLTPSGLTKEFRTIAGEAVVESLKGEDVSLSDKVTARFSDLLKIEKEGELVNGTPTQETLSQAENLLEDGDIAGAIAAVQSLDGSAGLATQSWLDQAKATLLADSLKTFLDQGVGSVAEGGELLPRESKFISDQKTGIHILVPGKSLGSSAYR